MMSNRLANDFVSPPVSETERAQILKVEPAAELLLLKDLVFLNGDRLTGDSAGNDDSDANMPFFLGVLLFGVFADVAGSAALSFSALFDSN